MLDLAQRIKKIFKLEKEVLIEGNSHHSIGVPFRNIYYPNINKATSTLGLEILSSLNSSIESTRKYLK